MEPDCEMCKSIVSEEQALDALASALDRRVAAAIQPAHEENDRRRSAFAARCRLPLVGRLYQRLAKAPVPVREPAYRDEPWYRDTGRTIERRADGLERRKAAHMTHWGDEIVSPADASDPAGRCTPDRTTRKKCYQLGLTPFLPGKYDYCSGARTAKHVVDLLVMCSETLALMPASECGMTSGESAGWKPVCRRSTPG